MIICHDYKFIFVKTHKTAGTSIEISLSRFCGSRDTLTKISPDDESIRQSLGYTGPQNYTLPLGGFSVRSLAKKALGKELPTLYNHVPAAKLRQYVPKHVWQNYFKFCIERNPWEKLISMYWMARKQLGIPLSLDEFVDTSKARRIADWDTYTDGSQLLVDRVFQYSEIDQLPGILEKQLSLPDTPQFPFAKGAFRPTQQSTEITDKADEFVRDICADEIELFNYERPAKQLR